MSGLPLTDAVRERFWSKVNKDGPVPPHRSEIGPCWVWTAGVTRRYGNFLVTVGPGRKANFRSHRFSWILANGEIPDGLNVLHHCDNPLCVRPSHLFIGTMADNMQDCVRKGRYKYHPAGPAAKGEAAGPAKLTAVSVKEIRERYAAGESQGHLAKEYGVTQGAVSRLVSRETWAHLA